MRAHSEKYYREAFSKMNLLKGTIDIGNSSNLVNAEKALISLGYKTEKIEDKQYGTGIKFNKLELEATQ